MSTISNAAGSNGKVTTIAAGSVTITATLGSISGSTALIIKSPTATSPSSYTTPIVGVLPAGLAIDAPGDVWVTNFGINTITELPYGMTASGGVISPVSSDTFSLVGASPFGIAIDFVGNVWTTSYNDNSVRVIVPNTPPSYCIPSAEGSPPGAPYYVGIAKPAGVGSGPRGIAIDSQKNVWVTNFGTTTTPGSTVTELSYANYNVCSTFSVTLVNGSYIVQPQDLPFTATTYNVGNSPYGIAIDSLGNAWVTNFGDNTVSEILTSGSVAGPFPVGAGPMGLAIDPSGNVWVANSGGNTVTELSSSGAVLGTFPVGTGPHNIAIETSGNVWVTNFGSTTSPGNTVTELVFNGSNVLQSSLTFSVGKNPEGISIDFWGNVWVTNFYDNTLTVWEGATTGPHFSPYSGPVWP